jgi:inosose dehydratase
MDAHITRRDFLVTGAATAAGAAMSPSLFASEVLRPRRANIAAGITIDTRPDWNGPENFLRAMDEAAQIGYRMIEFFPRDMGDFFNDPARFRDELQKRNLGVITIDGSNNFTDPDRAQATIDRSLEIARLIHQFGGRHLKLNVSGEQPRGQASQRPEVYRQMARTMNDLGQRLTDMGMKLGVHAHLNAAFETRQDIDAVMELTDPRHVWFILDTGHITMAGIDPVQLTRDYLPRIIEYHMKDTAAEDRGGTRRTMGRMVVPTPGESPNQAQLALQQEYPGIDPADYPASIRFRNRHFFELGAGGVDFPAILKLLDDASWSGWMTVELDSTVTTSQGSATVSKQYLERILGLDVERPGQRPAWST